MLRIVQTTWMDSLDKHDKDEHDHHIEGSNTSYNDNFLIIMQVSDSIECKKKKKSKTNKHQFS
jgi:hypothetical protein